MKRSFIITVDVHTPGPDDPELRQTIETAVLHALKELSLSGSLSVVEKLDPMEALHF